MDKFGMEIAITICAVLYVIFRYFAEKCLWNYGYCRMCGGELLLLNENGGFISNKFQCSYCKNIERFTFNFKKGFKPKTKK